jgi:tetratricopeptide (TPR) repeat protein
MEKNGIVSATLAEIYLEQGYPEKAIAIYSQLLLKDPGNVTYKAKLASIKKTLKE